MIRNILSDVTNIDENISDLRIDVVMLPEPPLGLIDDLGKNQGCADAVQDFRAVKNFIGRGRSGDVHIDEILVRAALRHDSRRERIAPPGGRNYVDLGIFFLKQLYDRAQLTVTLKKIKR